MHIERLPAPIVIIAPSGDDSLLVYTRDNILYHYIIDVSNATVRLMQVGQINLHDIIRAPSRVRALSWIIPEEQIRRLTPQNIHEDSKADNTADNGDPTQDVSVATILFLVDGKLVLLQPTTTEFGDVKYEMRIIAQNVETYALMRDHPAFALEMHEDSLPSSPSAGLSINGVHGHDLRDSLWYFDGHDMRCWIDMQDVLASASVELGRELPVPVKIPVDFYPLAALINKGIVFGVESELVQRRDTSFAYLRFGTRVRCAKATNCAHAYRHADTSLSSCAATASSGTVQLACGLAFEPPLPAPAVLSACARDLITRSSRRGSGHLAGARTRAFTKRTIFSQFVSAVPRYSGAMHTQNGAPFMANPLF